MTAFLTTHENDLSALDTVVNVRRLELGLEEEVEGWREEEAGGFNPNGGGGGEP